MSSLFKGAARSIRATPFVVPVFLVFLAMFVIGLGTTWEDLVTSYLGYQALPTKKASEWVGYLVALIPTVGLIGFSYIFIDDTAKRWAGLVALMLHVVDVGTDVYFKAQGGDWLVYLVAIVESEVIFTLGSELMLTISMGMILHLWPDLRREVDKLGLARFLASLIKAPDEPERPQGQPQPGRQSGDPRQQQGKGQGGGQRPKGQQGQPYRPGRAEDDDEDLEAFVRAAERSYPGETHMIGAPPGQGRDRGHGGHRG